MQTSRPVFLELWRIKLPLPGLVSILHRASGVLMVLTIPFAAILLHLAASGQQGFESAAGLLDSWWVGLFLVGLVWSLMHHLLAGIRHLVLDIGVGLDRPVARSTAATVLVAGLVSSLLLLVLGVIS
ncbi:succinate dehydrogenase, cytochrome b556 subunit [Thiorhodococcus fuscus]|uniref:Succinate dehydrogenase cytochrome b556 subunit n=1 Tax=Thiorhodococcus fuscus TaxID=527200 RepID=A0ABW4Y7W3_9GAMM